MMLNEDYRDILRAFADERVRFLLVGAYALAAHGVPRATMDIDLWVEPSAGNARAVLAALARFGAPLHDLTEEDLSQEGTVFQIGVAPRRIDILTGVSGLAFAGAFERSFEVEMDGIRFHLLSLPDLVANKRACGRHRDLADLEALGERVD